MIWYIYTILYYPFQMYQAKWVESVSIYLGTTLLFPPAWTMPLVPVAWHNDSSIVLGRPDHLAQMISVLFWFFHIFFKAFLWFFLCSHGFVPWFSLDLSPASGGLAGERLGPAAALRPLLLRGRERGLGAEAAAAAGGLLSGRKRPSLEVKLEKNWTKCRIGDGGTIG